MLEILIAYLNSRLEATSYIKDVLCLAKKIEREGVEYPAIYINSEFKRIDLDKYSSVSYWRKLNDVSYSEQENTTKVGQIEYITSVNLRLIVFLKKDKANDSVYFEDNIIEAIKSLLSSNTAILNSALKAKKTTIIAKKYNSNGREIANDEYSKIDFEPRYNYAYFSIDFEIKIVSNQNCFNTVCDVNFTPPTPAEIVTFCERVNNCLGISENGSITKVLNERGEWIENGSGGGGLTCEDLPNCEVIQNINTPDTNYIPVKKDGGGYENSYLIQDEDGIIVAENKKIFDSTKNGFVEIYNGGAGIYGKTDDNNYANYNFGNSDFYFLVIKDGATQCQIVDYSTRLRLFHDTLISLDQSTRLNTLTADKVLYIDSNKIIRSSTVSPTQVENIVSDFDNKVPYTGAIDNLNLGDNILLFTNNSQLKQGNYDFGGQGGISQICSVGFENNWQSGINHIFDNNGFLRESKNCFDIIPDNSFDSSLRFKVGSIWTLDNGTSYICTDATVGSAVWELYGAITWISTNGTNLINHLTDTNNPHSTTATQVDALKRDGSNANSDIDIDTYSFNAKSLNVKGTGGNGHIGLKHQSSNATANSNEISLFAKSTGLFFKNDGSAVEQVESQTNKGAANGYTPLNSSTKIDLTYLPDAILGQVLYGGVVDASTAIATLTTNAKTKLGTVSSTITLTNNTNAITGYVANEGIYYIASAGGTFAGISFEVGDWLISIGSDWKKVDNTDAVTSVNGNTGAVVLTASNVGAPSGSGTSTGTNTGDNATNSQYSGLATSKEDTANKSTSIGDSASSVKFPVWSAIVSYFDLAKIKSILGITTLSGSNTGDQTITLTGDITGSGTGSFATTIGASKVTNSMLAGSIDLTSKVTGVLPIGNTTAGTISTQNYYLSRLTSVGAALTNGTGVQSMLPSGQQSLTVPSNKTFKFAFYGTLKKGTTSCAINVGFAGGTATISSMAWRSETVSSGYGITTPVTIQNSSYFNSSALDRVVPANVSALYQFDISGIFSVTTGGTFIPQIQFTADPGGTIQWDTNTYLEIIEIGSNTVQTIGSWT